MPGPANTSGAADSRLRRFFTSKHWALRLTRMLALFVIIVVALTMIFENSLIFFPSKDGDWEPAEFPKEDCYFTTSDGVKLHGWFVPAAGARGTLLWLHGNAGNLSHRADMIRKMRALPVSIFIIDYRGYGRSEGSPSEEGVYRDAQAAFEYLTKERRVPASRVVFFGKSLGGAPAIRLAAETECAGLIVQSCFTSAREMAKEVMPLLPLWLVIRSRFPNLESIAKVRAPKLVIHGPDDEMIPFWMGRKLFEAAPEPKEFYEVKGARHNDVYQVGGEEYLQRLGAFLGRVLPP